MENELHVTEKLENRTGKGEYSAERCINCLCENLKKEREYSKSLTYDSMKTNKIIFNVMMCLVGAFAAIVIGFGILLFKTGSFSYTTTVNQSGSETNTVTTDNVGNTK